MRIAILADTHGKFPTSVAECLHAADEIWHLGDFCDTATLEAVRRVGRPFFGVLGNNDFGIDLPEELVLERAGRTFRLVHIPPAPTRLAGAYFLLHGHTHVPRDEMAGTTRVLNPGTIGKPNKGAPPSYAWLDLDETTGAISWRLVRV